MKSEIETYYSCRASEYEKIYEKPERQENLKSLKRLLKDFFQYKSVLEIACGTGYWTEIISNTAHSIVAIDSSNEVLDIARFKSYKKDNVKFINDDALSLSKIKRTFDSAFYGFWFSHIQKNDIESFITNLHRKLYPFSFVVMIDNNYVEGSSTPVSRKDEEGNTFQLRKLEDGSEYEVLKNFYLEDELKYIFKNYSSNFEIINLKYYWMIKYNL
ncbi:MAG: class I SAM-dependent methyltransferase, partial [Ignavibacteriaceae bacterium]|nr:class I SAM-dependent methyltransferase [Ignavibacteriaceae bacterium]